MPEKRPRDEEPSSTSLQPLSARVPSAKRSRTDLSTNLAAEITQADTSVLGWVVSGVSSLLSSMVGQRPVSSRSEIRIARSNKQLAGRLPLGVRKLGEGDKEDGVLAEILKQDAKRKEEQERLASNETSVQVTTRPAARPSIITASSSSSSKLPRRSVSKSASPSTPVDDFLFDEGQFRVARPSETSQEVDVEPGHGEEEEEGDALGGTASQPIELSDSDSEGDGNSPDAPSIAASQSRPETPSHSTRRPPSRPRLSDYTPSAREYSWLSSSSSEASSSRIATSDRIIRRKRSSIISSHRDGKHRESDQLKHRRRVISRAMMNSTPEEQRKARRAVERWEAMASPAKSREAEYHQAVNRGEHSKMAFERLLSRDSGRKTIEDVLEKRNQAVCSPLKAYHRADESKRLAARQRESAVSDIVEEFRKSHLREEAAIAARLKPSTPTQMGKDRLKKVKSYLNNAAFRSDCKNQSVGQRDINTLVGSGWLNDEVINMYLIMVQNRNEEAIDDGAKGAYKDVYPMSTFFYQKLAEQGYEKAKLARWTKRAKIDIFAKDVILVPVNVGGMHWTAAAINMEKKRIEYYDSMGDGSRSRYKIFANLKSYLEQEHENKKGSPWDSSGWDFEFFSPKTPQQTNGSDCGVFSCQTLEAIARGRDLANRGEWDFASDNMPYIRQLMVYELGQAKLENRWPKEQ